MKKNSLTNVLLAIMGVSVLAMTVVAICTIQINILAGICRLISLIFVALYGFWLYKTPHGNTLKYAMLLAAATDILNSAIYLSHGKLFATNAIRIFVAAGVIYCAGRLDRIEQNRIILILLDAVSLILAIINTVVYSTSVGFITTLRIYGSFVLLTVLIIAYLVRYREHKEAGLVDKPYA